MNCEQDALWRAQSRPVEMEADGGGDSDAELQKMQAEAAKQLVEARLRKYKALEHRVGVCA